MNLKAEHQVSLDALESALRNTQEPSLALLMKIKSWKSQRPEFYSSRASSAIVRALRIDSPIIKELCKVVLVLMLCLAIMTAFVALAFGSGYRTRITRIGARVQAVSWLWGRDFHSSSSL